LGEVLTTPPWKKKKSVKKHAHAGCLLWRQNNPEVNYSTTRISGRGGNVSRGNIAQHTKRDEMRWAGHVARMGEERGGV